MGPEKPGKRLDCPLTRKECLGPRCMWWCKLSGTAPDGSQHDEWHCAVATLPLLLIENAKECRQLGGAIESWRNTEHQNFGGLAAALSRVAEASNRQADVLRLVGTLPRTIDG